MRIADEQQQAGQPDCAMVLGEDFQPPPVVNVDENDDLVARHITN